MSHPTIRTILGASAPDSLDPFSTALLVIDFQEEYFSGKLPIPDGTRALNNAKRLIAFADRHKLPVFHVWHVSPSGAPLFAHDSATAFCHKDIQPAAHHKVVKKNQISVFQGTELHHELQISRIKTLIISGLMTHACVSGAARDAVPLGYNVIVADDASATRDIEAPGGGTIAHDVLHKSALVTIADTFGAVMGTNAIVNLSVR
ncbi:cysteine hydrolase [Corallococcus sp. AB004]|uniref:cysteine hydrolase family protein n=1 Tax=Corallococcus TaxID=83461 RepID=UPI000EA38F8D|nr:isochorismatase family cysteine hydrolase [Corallococcus sp. AB038B]NPC72300.1 cysteine hydrolase [Corallococcus exiguus]NRD45668.1 cysteine hydrolase [Corallococcus exiguus]RKI03493.1 cysteine hydrolase [Corallococcus sp. AB038B]RKI39873.1 cysteine hydrolase [Corallococcus sp. AB004]